jgi:phosphate starvation-inducible PhoH-like protein
MIEKLIYLESVDLVEFLGVQNTKLDLIKVLFPKLRIVARGNLLIGRVDAEEELMVSLLKHAPKINENL